MGNDNSNDGVTRFSMSAEDTPADALENHPTFTGQGVINGGVRVDADGTTQQVNQVHRMTTSQLAQNMKSGLFGSLQNSAGFSIPYSQASDSATIEVEPGNPASRTTLKVAEAMGYIMRDKNGDYLNPPETPQAAEKRIAQANAQTQAAAVEKFNNPDAENLYSHVQTMVPESVLTAQMARAAAGQPVDVDFLAQASGKSAAEVSAMVGALQASFTGQAQRAAQESGVHPNDFANFSAWAREHRSQELTRAQHEQMLGRSTKSLRALAAEYLQNTTPSNRALQAGGYETFTHPQTKEAMVKLPNGMITSLKAARLMKLI
jgi:hypothetical protein